jgi:hypothetical protein
MEGRCSRGGGQAMKFKVNMECVWVWPDKLIKELLGTVDPEKVSKLGLASIKEALSQPMFK